MNLEIPEIENGRVTARCDHFWATFVLFRGKVTKCGGMNKNDIPPAIWKKMCAQAAGILHRNKAPSS